LVTQARCRTGDIGQGARWAILRRDERSKPDSGRPVIAGSSQVSKAAVSEILGRVLRERAFAAQIKAEPDRALAEYDLTDAERTAIVAGLRGAGGGAPLAQRPRAAGRIV